MIKTFLKILLIFVCMSFQLVFANPMKVNDITFDSSDSVIFIGTSNTANGEVQVKKGVLSNPDRIFLDIQNAVLTRKQGSFEIKNGKLSNVRISQFSNDPYVVRVVMTCTAKLHPQDVKVLSLGGNIIVKLENYKPTQDYLTPVYREEKTSAYDYFEKVRVSEEIFQPSMTQIVLMPAMPPSVKTPTTSQLQPAVPQNEPVRINQPLKESKLLSRFFVSNAYAKQNALLVAGTGIVNLEKVFYLSNPTRVVFDIPNSVSAAAVRNKTFALSPTETAKIGQFSATKTRIVITSPEAKKYQAIYSNDLQNILIARSDKLQGVKLYSNTSKVLTVTNKSTKEYKNNVNKLTFDFSEPIVHSIKRTDNALEFKLYNATTNSLNMIAEKVKSNGLTNATVKQNGTTGIEITIPIQDASTIDCLENLNAKRIVLTVKNPVTQTQQQTTQKHVDKKVVVIDPGHGGSDPGATRANDQEKKLTIDIAHRVVKKLKGHGAVVYITRDDDTFVSLADRVDFSNNKNPDLFVSIHINACEQESVHGVETHYYKDDSLDLAKYVHKSIMASSTQPNRGVFKSRFYVIRHTTAPAILLELGFISNEAEREMLKNPHYQEKVAEAITEGIINYLNNTGKK